MDLYKTREESMGLFSLTLEGDGSTTPNLVVKGFSGHTMGHVDSDDLRKMAKTLKKWAKQLEEHKDGHN